MERDELIERYRRDGFVVVENVFDAVAVAALQAATDEFIERSRTVTEADGVFELEASHSAAAPQVRRIRTPHAHHRAYEATVRNSALLDVLELLLGSNIRFDTSKLNVKAASIGSAVEWHQDWAFYPHTNDDLCAVGVMIDACDVDNGALLCVPGSHRGPVFDHHSNGAFCGAIDPNTPGVGLERAVPCVGSPGSVSIHHVRTVHGSAPNLSGRSRRLLLLQYRAADAWPLEAMFQPTWTAWTEGLVRGSSDNVTVRCSDVAARLPLPPALHQGSLYENQRALTNPYFTTAVGDRT